MKKTLINMKPECEVIPGTLDDDLLHFFYENPDDAYSAIQIALMCKTPAPYTTVRRHLIGLVDSELIEYTEDGKFRASIN